MTPGLHRANRQRGRTALAALLSNHSLQIGTDRNQKSGDGSPICPEAVVTVWTIGIVQSWHVDMLFLNQIEVRTHNTLWKGSNSVTVNILIAI